MQRVYSADGKTHEVPVGPMPTPMQLEAGERIVTAGLREATSTTGKTCCCVSACLFAGCGFMLVIFSCLGCFNDVSASESGCPKSSEKISIIAGTVLGFLGLLASRWIR